MSKKIHNQIFFIALLFCLTSCEELGERYLAGFEIHNGELGTEFKATVRGVWDDELAKVSVFLFNLLHCSLQWLCHEG